MKKTISPWLVFIGLSLIISVILFSLPINLFPGEIVMERGLSTITLKDHNLSLSYFVGMGLTPGDLEGVKSFKLTPWGWALAFCYIFLLPGIIAYRIHMKQKAKS
jgi:hypothetical protein